jgi:hypothetical protein
MSKHPVNLAVRFMLEVLGLSTFGVWGYQQSDIWTRILLAIILPLGYAVLWGVFAVKDDPSRSGKTVVQTPGTIRLILELLLFGAATWMLHSLGYSTLGFIFGGVVILHYILSYDRIAWLLKQK